MRLAFFGIKVVPLLGISFELISRKKALSRLLDLEKIRSARVEGINTTFYYLSDDDLLMQSIIKGVADLKPRMSLIAPLDPLLWDKSMVMALWDYKYSWEIYTPAAKRRYGYYTLPILFGDIFIGRIETAINRKEHMLVVKGLWWEQGVRQTKKIYKALEKTLRRFSRFNDCIRFVYTIDEKNNIQKSQ